MGNDIRQFKSEEDGCIYFYDAERREYRKVCSVGGYHALPLSVRRQVLQARKKAIEDLQMPAPEGE